MFAAKRPNFERLVHSVIELDDSPFAQESLPTRLLFHFDHGLIQLSLVEPEFGPLDPFEGVVKTGQGGDWLLDSVPDLILEPLGIHWWRG